MEKGVAPMAAPFFMYSFPDLIQKIVAENYCQSNVSRGVGNHLDCSVHGHFRKPLQLTSK